MLHFANVRLIRATLLFSLLFLIGCTKPGGSSSSQDTGREEPIQAEATDVSPTPTVDAAPTPFDVIEPRNTDPAPTVVDANTCSELRVATPRGLSCLHCMEPAAGAQVPVLLDIVKRSCLRNVALMYLVDGTFSFNAPLLSEQIASVSEGGRRPFIYFYITNGPSQRIWDRTPINSFGTQIPPEEFRDRITSDRAFQNEYQGLVARLIPVIRFVNSLGGASAIIPALEDNLTRREFDVMVSLALEVIPPDVAIGIGRNPCPGCYSGSDSSIPSGIFEDRHTQGTSVPANGLVSNDGIDISDFDLDVLRPTRDASSARNSTFILWNTARQGLPSLDASQAPHPRNRSYAIPNEAEQRAIVEFLRGGF